MDDCVRHLLQEQEAPDDEALVVMARAHRVMEDVGTAMPSRLPDSDKWQSSGTPPMLLVKSLRANLDEIRRATSQETLKNSTPLPASRPPVSLCLLTRLV